jgi:hypothetical protein
MGNLTTVENSAISTLQPVHQQFMVAKFKKPIKDYDDYTLEKGIKNLILVSYAELGLKVDPEDKVVTFLIETLLKDLRRHKYEHITLEEIQLFISLGLRGELGTFNGQMNTLNVQNLNWWIKKGIESEDRKNAIREFNAKLSKEQTPVIPTIQKVMFSKQACVDAFVMYRDKGVLQFCAFAYYDIINDLIGEPYKGQYEKTLVHDEDARKLIVSECKESIEKDFMPQKIRAEKAGNLNESEAIMGAILGDHGHLLRRMKAAFLKYYFDQLIKEGKELIL